MSILQRFSVKFIPKPWTLGTALSFTLPNADFPGSKSYCYVHWYSLPSEKIASSDKINFSTKEAPFHARSELAPRKLTNQSSFRALKTTQKVAKQLTCSAISVKLKAIKDSGYTIDTCHPLPKSWNRMIRWLAPILLRRFLIRWMHLPRSLKWWFF